VLGNIAAGAASGIMAQKADHISEPDHLREHTESLALIYQTLCEIKDALDIVTDKHGESDYFELISLPQGNEYVLHDNGRNYTSIFAPDSNIVIQLFIHGVGTVNLALQAGWNELNLPDNTTLKITSGTGNLLFKASNNRG
jgi:hypothetical protein